MPLAIAGALAAAIAAVTFPYVLVTQHAQLWGEWVLGPCLFVWVGVGIAGAAAPTWWTPKRTLLVTFLAILALVGRLLQARP